MLSSNEKFKNKIFFMKVAQTMIHIFFNALTVGKYQVIRISIALNMNII